MNHQPTPPQSTPLRSQNVLQSPLHSTQPQNSAQKSPCNHPFGLKTPLHRRYSLDPHQGNSSPLKVKSLSQSYRLSSNDNKLPEEQNKSNSHLYASQEVARNHPASLSQSQVSKVSQVSQVSKVSSVVNWEDDWEADHPKLLLLRELNERKVAFKNIDDIDLDDLYSSGRRSTFGK